MKKDAEIYIIGIRHHGPGSAKSLLTALQELDPDVIALELMDDQANMIELLTHEDLEPPISLLLHVKDQSTVNVLLPFAHFSPEWQAIQYAQSKDIHIESIDLPYAFLSALDKEESPEQTNENVLLQLAELSGFENVESWWDHFLERKGKNREVFVHLQDIMMMVREQVTLSGVDELREAYMRIKLRKLSRKHKKIAVVCGAFHGPALSVQSLEENKNDEELIRGLKKNKVACTLIPYTYQRLSKSSGYTSGVTAPLFYEMLFTEQSDIAVKWLSHAAQVLRNKGFSASVDEVMSGVHLSNQLCHLRELEVPGLAELKEAALSTLCLGQEERLQLLVEEAFIGHKIGHVPEHLIQSPFISDFYQKVKTFRLSPYWQPEASAKDKKVKSLDLRKDLHLNCSHFLHQLNLLNMQWAELSLANERAHGSFHENWRFHWDIEDEIQLHHNSTLGATVSQAAGYSVLEKVRGSLTLQEAIYLLDKVLLANLPDPVSPLLQRLNVLTARSEDIHELLNANIRLIEIAKYGSVRRLDTNAIFTISQRLHKKICNQLPYSCQPMAEESSYSLFQKIAKYYQLLRQTQFEGWMQDWIFALELLRTHSPLDGRISGFSLRILHDQTEMDKSSIHTELVQQLDSAFEPMQQAIWLEGFLYGGGSVLFYNDALFDHLAFWVKSIDEETFMMVLPILNRSFASYPTADRQMILQKVRTGKSQAEIEPDNTDQLLEWSMNELIEAFNKLD